MIKYTVIVILLCILPVKVIAQKTPKQKADSLIAEIKNYQDDTNKVRLYLLLGRAYENLDTKEGIRYTKTGLELSERLGWKWGAMASCSRLGMYYYSMADYAQALKYNFEFLRINEERGDIKNQAKAHLSIGNVYHRQKDFVQSLKYQQQALRLFAESGDSKGVALAQMGVGNVFLELKNYDSALSNYYRVLSLSKAMHDSDALARSYGNIGNVYLNMQDYENALKNMLIAVYIQQALGNIRFYALNLGNIGEAYLGIAKTGKSNKQAELNMAISYLERAVLEGKKLDNDDVVLEFTHSLAEAYSLAGMHEKAYAKLNESYKLRDTVFSAANENSIARLETQREAMLKDKQIEVNNALGKQKRAEQVFFVSGMLLLSVLVLIVLRNNRKQKMSNARLADEKNKSEAMAQTLQESLVIKDQLAMQLEQSAVMKARFLANISHELRTPVTLIAGMLELMREKVKEEDEYLSTKVEVAYANSRKLQHMVGEILDLSKQEARATAPHMGEVEISSMLKRMVFAFETLIQNGGLSLHFNSAGIEGVCVLLDEVRFEKIVNNLVYNAIKFNNPGGSIVVSGFIVQDGNYIELQFTNTGKAISAQDLPHIFDRFFQGNGEAGREEGAGIGLALVREFTLEMNGTVDVKSNTDGTTFVLQFPIVKNAPSEITTVQPFTEPETHWDQFGTRQTVLLVEDNNEMRYYVREILGDKVNIAEAGNGREAIEWLRSNTPDLIISDVMMPEMDGKEFVDRIKKDQQLRRIPVITLTALNDNESRMNMLRLGIDDYIAKPFNAAELRIRTFNLLQNQKERLLFTELPPEPDDIPEDSKDAVEFRIKVTEYVLARIKTTSISVFDLAYELNMSERQLYRCSKNLTGCTPAQLIKEVRLQRALELLQAGDITKVEDVANRVGYDTAAYFSRQFYERFGKKATEFL